MHDGQHKDILAQRCYQQAQARAHTHTHTTTRGTTTRSRGSDMPRESTLEANNNKGNIKQLQDTKVP